VSGQVPAQEIVERTLAAADGDCIAVLREGSTANLRWANSTLTTNGAMRSRELTVIRFVEGRDGIRTGVVARSQVDPAGLEDFVKAAERAAQDSTPADDAAPLVADRQSPDWDQPPTLTGAEVFDRFAPALGRGFDAARKDARHLYGFAEHDLTTTYLGSTSGLRLRHTQPTGKVEVTGKSADLTRSAWVGRYTQDFSDVDPEALDGELATRLGWAERTVSLDAGRYETIVPPGAVADLMVYAYWMSAAREANEGSTVFSKPGGGTRVGEQLSTVPFTLSSDPSYPGLECQPFVVATVSGAASSVFDNGLPLERTDWIRDGELAALMQTRYSAELTGLSVTPEIDNLILTAPGATKSMEEMVADTKRGLLLTCLWYIREVDPETLLLTGLTRDGVYLVENGEVVGAANNFRFNESPIDLLARASEVGATENVLCREWNDYFTRMAMPPLRIPDFNMSTVSQAR
jgi:predicted Zn-dependent protease